MAVAAAAFCTLPRAADTPPRRALHRSLLDPRGGTADASWEDRDRKAAGVSSFLAPSWHAAAEVGVSALYREAEAASLDRVPWGRGKVVVRAALSPSSLAAEGAAASSCPGQDGPVVGDLGASEGPLDPWEDVL